MLDSQTRHQWQHKVKAQFRIALVRIVDPVWSCVGVVSVAPPTGCCFRLAVMMAASQLCSRIIKLAKGYLANRRAFSVCTSAYMDTLSWHTDTVRYVQHIHKYTENATAMVRPIDGGYWDSTSEPIPPRPKPTIPTKGENSAPKQPKKWFMKCLFLWRIREIREIQQLFTSCLYTKYKARARSQLARGSFRLPLHPKIDSSMSNVVNVTALTLPCVLYLGIDTSTDGTRAWSQRA